MCAFQVSETGLNIDERREFAKQILTEFQNKCWESLRRLLCMSVTSSEEKGKTVSESQACEPINVSEPTVIDYVDAGGEVLMEASETGSVPGDVNGKLVVADE